MTLRDLITVFTELKSNKSFSTAEAPKLEWCIEANFWKTPEVRDVLISD